MARFMLLIFLVSLPETYTTEDVTVVYGIEGEPISINCTYSPKANKWRKKSWCKNINEMECQHVVSARQFWMPFRKSWNGTTAIADYIQKGVLMVTINPLRKQDAGLYQCKADFLGIVNTLQKVKVNVLTETETLEEPEAVHSTSSNLSDPEFKVHILVVGFLGFKLLAAVAILLIAKSKKNKTTTEERRGPTEHQLFSIAGEMDGISRYSGRNGKNSKNSQSAARK